MPAPPPPPPPPPPEDVRLAGFAIPLAQHQAMPEFARGTAAAAVNVVATFPLAKLTSRQAYEGLTAGEALGTMRHEGAWHLYRGLLPPLLQQSLKMGVMYGAYDFLVHQLFFLRHGRELEAEAGAGPGPGGGAGGAGGGRRGSGGAGGGHCPPPGLYH